MASVSSDSWVASLGRVRAASCPHPSGPEPEDGWAGGGGKGGPLRAWLCGPEVRAGGFVPEFSEASATYPGDERRPETPWGWPRGLLDHFWRWGCSCCSYPLGFVFSELGSACLKSDHASPQLLLVLSLSNDISPPERVAFVCSWLASYSVQRRGEGIAKGICKESS